MYSLPAYVVRLADPDICGWGSLLGWRLTETDDVSFLLVVSAMHFLKNSSVVEVALAIFGLAPSIFFFWWWGNRGSGIMDCHYLLSLRRFLCRLALRLVLEFSFVVSPFPWFVDDRHKALAESMIHKHLCQAFGNVIGGWVHRYHISLNLGG